MPLLPTLPVQLVDEDGNRDDFVLRACDEDADACDECGGQTPLMLEQAGDSPVHGLWCAQHVAWDELRVTG